MSRLEELILQKKYELECLLAYKGITDSGDCNTCKSKRDCEYTPEVGQLVRYNCPFFKENKDV